jgi:hypothetical protein
VDDLVRRAVRGQVTLVFAAKDELHNQAVVLRGVIERRLRGRMVASRQRDDTLRTRRRAASHARQLAAR